MRDYGKVSPQFWIGKTGKALRGNAEAQILALYLMTSPHANMIGVYHCPIAYMAHETGLTIEGASKALRWLIEADFCTFDAEDEYVFVHQFALHQVGESLSVSDKRCKGVENELSKVPKNQCWQAFRNRYAGPYNIQPTQEKTSPSEAPQKPLASQKQKQEQKQNMYAPGDAGCTSADAESNVKTVTARMLVAEGVDKQAADDWLTLRKAKRLPLTPTAWSDTKAEGEKVGLTAAETVAHAVRSNWAGFKSSWYLKDAAQQPPASAGAHGLAGAI